VVANDKVDDQVPVDFLVRLARGQTT
jgi:hypothetical protein